MLAGDEAQFLAQDMKVSSKEDAMKKKKAHPKKTLVRKSSYDIPYFS